MAMTYPVIVVPGITGSLLRDEYPLPPETVWSVLKKDYARAAQHPDDTRYEAREPARVRPDHLILPAYNELVEELRHNLRQRDDRPVPVYPFTYDWRQPLPALEEQLGGFVAEVIERTLLLRHYRGVGDAYGQDPRVHLVGHSMGGLIIAGYLERFGGARVGRVATLATPWRGSFEAPLKLATGTSSIMPDAQGSREREAARVTPSLYHLIPTCPTLAIDPVLPQTDLFDTALWQPGIVATLGEFVRLYGVKGTGYKEQAGQLFERLLAAGRAHRERMEHFRPETAGLGPDDWLCVVGVDYVTRVRLQVAKGGQGPEFVLASSDRQNHWRDGATEDERRQTGDGTVPLPGALPAFIPENRLVCVTPGDFGYWEIQDQVLSAVAGFHGILPNLDMLHRMLVRFLTGAADPHGNTWGRPVPGVSEEDWDPPFRPKLPVK